MTTYRLVKDHGRVVLYVCDVHSRTALPLLVDDMSRHLTLTVAVTLLLDYFGGEDRPEVKAQTLSKALAHRLVLLGEEWILKEDQLNNLVTEIMVSRKEFVDGFDDCRVEIVSACRRDTLRLGA